MANQSYLRSDDLCFALTRFAWLTERSVSSCSLTAISVSNAVGSEAFCARYRSPLPYPHRSWELRMHELKSHLVRTQSLNVLSLKPGVGQYIAIHDTLTVRDFFLAYVYPSGPFTGIFFPNLSRFFLCWLWLTHGSCVSPQNKIGHPARVRFPC